MRINNSNEERNYTWRDKVSVETDFHSLAEMNERRQREGVLFLLSFVGFSFGIRKAKECISFVRDFATSKFFFFFFQVLV